MKDYSYILLILALCFICCQSREEKVLDTIKNEVFRTLADFDSYEPIETKVDSLKYDKYGDTLVLNYVLRMKLMDEVIERFDENYEEAKRIFDIWDDPRMYRYSSFAYNKRKDAYKDMQSALLGKEVTEDVRKSYLDTLLILSQNHTGRLYGWRVSHRFRYKTKDGTPNLHEYTYCMDKKCENILFRFDEDDFSWHQYVRYVDKAYNEAKERTDTANVAITE